MDLVSPHGQPVLFTPGEWVQITQHARINTADHHDGEVQVWINGESVLIADGLRLVTNGDLVDTFF
ncbi:MAG: hypothetical protein J6386_19860 [Candidatus Synoicihabitans palmerolidicus]|nr:hypothetical protein [Candidatus Synoicihabitans palmerolidicus]